MEILTQVWGSRPDQTNFSTAGEYHLYSAVPTIGIKNKDNDALGGTLLYLFFQRDKSDQHFDHDNILNHNSLQGSPELENLDVKLCHSPLKCQNQVMRWFGKSMNSPKPTFGLSNVVSLAIFPD